MSNELETARLATVSHIARLTGCDGVVANETLRFLEKRGLVKISCRRGLGPQCGCKPEAIRRVELGGTCGMRSEEHTSELQSLMRISYAVFCLKKQNTTQTTYKHTLHYHIIHHL